MIYACPICKALSFRRALCAHCATHLHAKLEPVVRELEFYNTYSLFTWERDGWRGLRWWIRALKGREHRYFWREPAVWALDTFPRLTGPAFFVPVPSTKARNHARGFARALGHYSGWPVAELLLPQNSRLQKTLSRAARAKRRFLAVDTPRPRGTCILIDDVVTSGATARAAHRALGAPRNFQVWCLMDRRPCGVLRPLL